MTHTHIPEINIAQYQTVDIPSDPNTTQPSITVWMHGSKLLFSKYIPYFSFCPLGLSTAQSIPEKYYHRVIANTLTTYAPHLFSMEHFYFFGWSGKLSFIEREEQGYALYSALKKLKADYSAQYGCIPHIRLITHSHGGNAALNMAKFYEKDPEMAIMRPFINDLILLACPVQIKTKHYIHSECFENITSFFSSIDSFQVLDPQGMYEYKKNYRISRPLFSERKFEKRHNLVQCCVYKGWRGIGHVEFILGDFLKQFGTIITAIEHTKKNNPSHDVYKLIL